MQIITTVCAKLSKLTILGLEVLNVSIHRYTAGVRIKRQLNFVPVPWEFCHHEVKTPVRVLSSWNKKRKNFIIVNKIFYSIRIIHTIWQGAPRTTCTELNLNYIFHVMSWHVMICHDMSCHVMGGGKVVVIGSTFGHEMCWVIKFDQCSQLNRLGSMLLMTTDVLWKSGALLQDYS